MISCKLNTKESHVCSSRIQQKEHKGIKKLGTDEQQLLFCESLSKIVSGKFSDFLQSILIISWLFLKINVFFLYEGGESFLYTNNTMFGSKLYKKYCKKPSSIHISKIKIAFFNDLRCCFHFLKDSHKKVAVVHQYQK